MFAFLLVVVLLIARDKFQINAQSSELSTFTPTDVPTDAPTFLRAASPTHRPTSSWFDFTPTNFVECSTTQGSFVIKLYRDWAPIGVDHLLELVNKGFYTNVALFRVVSNFIAQFGVSENEEHWIYHQTAIDDDVNLGVPFYKYTVSFAGAGPNTRTTQLFIALNNYEDFFGSESWEIPLGVIIAGKTTLRKFYAGYGDFPPYGNGPSQQLVYEQGQAYLNATFPLLDYILSCQEISAPTYKPTSTPTNILTNEPTDESLNTVVN